MTDINIHAATRKPGEPHYAGQRTSERSIWFSWTPSVTGLAYLDTLGSGYDTLLAVYTGNALNALTEVAANDDAGGPDNLRQSMVHFRAHAGTIYRLAVAAKGPGGSPLADLRWSLTPSPPNDEFAAAQALAGEPRHPDRHQRLCRHPGAGRSAPRRPAHHALGVVLMDTLGDRVCRLPTPSGAHATPTSPSTPAPRSVP